MNRLQKLRTQRANSLKQMRAIEAEAEQSENGKLTEEQTTKVKALIESIAQLDADIEIAVQMGAINGDDAPTPANPTRTQTGQTTGRVTEPESPAPTRDGDGFQSAPVDVITSTLQSLGRLPRIEVRGPTDAMRQTHGFRSMGDMCNSVLRAVVGKQVDPRLFGANGASQAATTFANENTGEAGGFAVPPQFEQQIWAYTFDDSSSILARMAPMPTSSNRVSQPTSEDTPWGGGITADWIGEGAVHAQKRPNLKNHGFSLAKLGVLAPVTDEMLEDSAGFESFLFRKSAEAINWKAAEALVNGDGNGKPLGYMTSGALVTVAKETSQTADTIVAANITKMYARLLNPTGAFWLVAHDAYPQIPLLTIGNQPIWTAPSEGMKSASGGSLLGLPVVLSDHNETVGDKGDIHLVAPSGYHARTKVGGIKTSSSIHLYFDQDVGCFKFIFRLGGQPYATAPVTPPKQTASTRSHFVTLAARA